MVIIVVFIGLAANIIIAFFLDFDSLLADLSRLSWHHVLVPFLIYIGIYFVDSIRLKIVLHQFSYKIKFKDAFTNSVFGYLFSYLTPMATGGQPFQIYHLASAGIDAKTSTNVIMSRFIIYLGSALILTMAFIPRIIVIVGELGPRSIFLYAGLAATTVITLVIILLFIRPDAVGSFLSRIENSRPGRLITKISRSRGWGDKAKSWSVELKENIAFLWKERLHIILIDTILSTVILGMQVFSLAYVFMSLAGISLNFFDVFITVLLLNLVVYYIPSPGAAGGIEGVYSMVFAHMTGQPQLCVLSITAWRFATYYLQIALGLFFFARLQKIKIAPGEKNQSS